MPQTLPLHVKPKKDHVVVLYGGTTLMKVSKVGMTAFLAGLGLTSEPEQKMVKGKKKKARPVDEKMVKAVQFAKAYVGAKRKFYHKKTLPDIQKTEPAFKHCLKAVEIVDRHGVTYKRFLKAQVRGLNFVDNGKGIFPRINQVSTEQAEQRLLEYMRAGSDDEQAVNISPKERNTKLNENRRYVVCARKVKDGIASIQETTYVQALQRVRMNKVKDYVKKHLKKLKS